MYVVEKKSSRFTRIPRPIRCIAPPRQYAKRLRRCWRRLVLPLHQVRPLAVGRRCLWMQRFTGRGQIPEAVDPSCDRPTAVEFAERDGLLSVHAGVNQVSTRWGTKGYERSRNRISGQPMGVLGF